MNTPNPNPSPELIEAIKSLRFQVDFQRGYGSKDIRLTRDEGDLLIATLSPQTLPAPGEVKRLTDRIVVLERENRNYAKTMEIIGQLPPAPGEAEARAAHIAAYSGPVVSFDVTAPYYLASCDSCGWVGSSEHCGTDTGCDDSNVYCPRCDASGADCGKIATQSPPWTIATVAAANDEGVASDTVAFVQDWLMNSDYDPTQFDKEFAAALDARVNAAYEAAVKVADDYEQHTGDAAFDAATDVAAVTIAERIRLLSQGGGKKLFCEMPDDQVVAIARCDIKRGEQVTAVMLGDPLATSRSQHEGADNA